MSDNSTDRARDPELRAIPGRGGSRAASGHLAGVDYGYDLTDFSRSRRRRGRSAANNRDPGRFFLDMGGPRPHMRPHDANARASVRSPEGRTHAATVTSLLGTPGFQPPGLMEMRMRHAAAFAGEPARFFDIHPAVSAVSPRQEALHPRLGLRPADGGLRPRAAARQVSRARGRPRRRRDLLCGQGQPGARGGGGDRGARRALRLRLARRDRPLPVARRSRPERIAFGNTIKKAADIAHAHAAGVGSSPPTPRRSSTRSRGTRRARG